MSSPDSPGDPLLAITAEDYRFLVTSVADYAIFMLDATGVVRSWNLGAERIKGYRAEEIVGRHFSSFYPPEDNEAGKPARELEEATREGRVEDEGWRLRKDGTRFWANVVITALRGPDGAVRGFAKVTRDLTERKRAVETERELVREQAAREAAEKVASRAEEAGRIKDEFLATASHELRTPLNAIVGWTLLLQRQPQEPMLSRGLEVIARNAQAQVRIIEDILDVSRLVAGKMRIEVRPTDLAALVREAVDVLLPTAAAKQITVDLSSAPGPGTISADPERLRQAVWNLLSNAVKFTDAGGRIDVLVAGGASQATITVRDTGRGIDPAFLPFVFERFKQEEGSTTRRFGGLGIGLSIVRHIVELHGGTVTVESAGVGAGATFSITIPTGAVTPAAPVSRPREGITTATMRAISPRTGALAGLRVVLVEDEDDSRELMRAVLEGAGAEVASAASAGEGLRALEAFSPHVVVSDIGMPGEDGHSFIRRARERDPSAPPAIALTAYTRAEDRAKALAAGFVAHVSKPVMPEELIDLIASVTEGRGA